MGRIIGTLYGILIFGLMFLMAQFNSDDWMFWFSHGLWATAILLGLTFYKYEKEKK